MDYLVKAEMREIILLLIALGWGLYRYLQYQDDKKKKAAKAAAKAAERRESLPEEEPLPVPEVGGTVGHFLDSILLGDEFVARNEDMPEANAREAYAGYEDYVNDEENAKGFLNIESQLYKGGEYAVAREESAADATIRKEVEVIIPHPMMEGFDPAKAVIWAEILKRRYC